jgi:hypothetical protein
LALRQLLDHLPPGPSAEDRSPQDWRRRLHALPEAKYDEFEHALRLLGDPSGICVRPVLVVDEFERLLDPAAEEGFPFPDFFDGVRALITADLLAMIVASRRPLVDYFRHPVRPDSLTSTFPSYFMPFPISLLDDAAADALLLQPSDRPLTLEQVAQARRWAGGHPCHLQVAGQAWYEARGADHPPWRTRQRFRELRRQCCMAGTEAVAKTSPLPRWLWRMLRAAFWGGPLRVGRLAQRLGARVDDVAAWIVGAAVIVLLVLVLLRVVKAADLVGVIKNGLGLK